MSTPTPERIQRAIDNTDANIRMFSGYRDTDWNRSQLERLRAERVTLVELAEGKVAYESLPWPIKEKFYDMPAWATYGT